MTDSGAADLAHFSPYEELAAKLLPLAATGADGSHDLAHLRRVWANARAIAGTERDCDLELLAAAVLLHDCVPIEKNSPLRSQASRLSADRARQIMERLGFDAARLDALAHAIAAHSFSAGVEPRTLEARVLQDADRLDAMGAIGVARCFYVAGRLGAQLYDPDDPSGAERPLDDARFALDHFAVKLLTLVDGFRTSAGREMAARRHALMQDFVRAFVDEAAQPASPAA